MDDGAFNQTSDVFFVDHKRRANDAMNEVTVQLGMISELTAVAQSQFTDAVTEDATRRQIDQLHVFCVNSAKGVDVAGIICLELSLRSIGAAMKM